jgi:hypothetical protein
MTSATGLLVLAFRGAESAEIRHALFRKLTDGNDDVRDEPWQTSRRGTTLGSFRWW